MASFHVGKLADMELSAGSNEGVSESSAPTEWIGRIGDKEPNPYAAMTTGERIEMVWPLTLAAWAFSGKSCDESRLRRDVESVSRLKR
jgi:hypothetical protein